MSAPASALRLSPKRRDELIALVKRSTTTQRTVRRAHVILDAADGRSNADIARRRGMTRPAVLALRARFAERGMEAVLQDAPRPGRPRRIAPETVDAIVGTVTESKPRNATHWTRAALARRFKIGTSSVQRILQAHRLQPERVEHFKFSTDPQFAAKVRDVVGLYVAPPRKALVFSVDEKSQIQALERTAPILPLRPGIPQRQTHDYRRAGTTTLFAALNMLDGTVIGKCLPRHRNEEFITFLDHLDRSVPKGLDVHLILDNYATHKHPNVKAWLARHPRYHVHFTPTSSSWLNMVERFFGEITARRIRRGSFRSVAELTRAINAYIADRNRDPKPFVWRASAARILKRVNKCRSIYGMGH